MLNIKQILVAGALAGALVGTAFAGGRLIPIENPAPIAANGVAKADVIKGIHSAAKMRNFRIAETQDNVVKLAYPAGARAQKYEAFFDVTYTGKAVEVKYASSHGLDAGPCKEDANQICIHRNVNKWMRNLASDIRNQLQ